MRAARLQRLTGDTGREALAIVAMRLGDIASLLGQLDSGGGPRQWRAISEQSRRAAERLMLLAEIAQTKAGPRKAWDDDCEAEQFPSGTENA